MKKTLVFMAGFTLVFLGVLAIVTCATRTTAPARPKETSTQSPYQEPRAPELAVNLSTRLFSPDDDGIDDELFMSVICKDESSIDEWRLVIMEPEEPNKTFFERSGKGSPPAQIVWNGRSSGGRLVQSASDYPFILTAKNIHGKSASYQGLIGVDILVVREGNLMKIQVPSIVFGSNSGSFTGLSEENLGKNDVTLRRVAQVLNKFDGYKVVVEGHANYTAVTESARRLEQVRELQPLSERRAQSVVDYLVKLGVDRSRLTAVGVGGLRPLVKYDDRDNWGKNRRVEFILVK